MKMPKSIGDKVVRLIVSLNATLVVNATPVTVGFSPPTNLQFLYASGEPLAGNHLCIYTGGTKTPLATYVDWTGTMQNGRCLKPGVGGVVLDAGDYAQIRIVPGTFNKCVLYNANGVLQWSEDNTSIDSAGKVGCAPSWFLDGSLIGLEYGATLIQRANGIITATDNAGASRVDYTINANGGGGAPDCSTTAAGIWDVIPQTCAGQRTFQGIAGSPSVTNFNILPPSYHRRQNLYSGNPIASFDAADSLPYIVSGYHAITGLNTDSIPSPGPYTHTLTVLGEGNVAEGNVGGLLGVGVANANASFGGIQGVTGVCLMKGGSSASLSCDAVTAFTDIRHLSSARGVVSFLAGTPNIAGSAHSYAAFSAADSHACGATKCYVWGYPDNKFQSYLDADTQDLVINGTIKSNASLIIKPHAFSALPAGNAVNEGRIEAVTNSDSNTWGDTVTHTTGTNHVLAYCDGTNWTVIGK